MNRTPRDSLSVIKGLIAKAGGKDADDENTQQVRALLRKYYQQVPPEDLTEADPGELLDTARAHHAFARRRPRQTPLIRIYNPAPQSRDTIVEIVTDNMPFLVDSISIALGRHGFSIRLIVHPVIRVQRDADGRLQAIEPPEPPHGDGGETIAEAWMSFRVEHHADESVFQAFREDAARVLGEIRSACDDWRAMCDKMEEITGALDAGQTTPGAAEVKEAIRFCHWIKNHNFTFLGYCEYDARRGDGAPVKGSKMGILRGLDARACHEMLPLSPAPQHGEIVVVTKSSTASRIHRPAYMDFIAVCHYDRDGRPLRHHCFVGLFTSTLYHQNILDVPLLRDKSRRIFERSGRDPGGHDGKALQDVLNNFPRDSLFQIPEERLFEMVVRIAEIQDRRQVRLLLYRDVHRRFHFCMVYLPRDIYNRNLRKRIEDMLMRSLAGTGIEFGARFSESVLARIHFTVHTPVDSEPEYDEQQLELEAVKIARTWSDRLREALARARKEKRGNQLFNKYGDSFPQAYQGDFSAAAAVRDILVMEGMRDADDLGIGLYKTLPKKASNIGLKLFSRDNITPLSDTLPVLENMGVRVIAEKTYQVHPHSSQVVWVHDFLLQSAGDRTLDLERNGENFTESFLRTWNGAAENDRFNRMALVAGLNWREVSVLRAYCKYLRQIRVRYSENYMIETLGGNPNMAGRLIHLFHALFDPEGGGAPEQTLLDEINDGLERVANLDEDRILRAFLNVMRSTLRTNYYQTDAGGRVKPYLSFKLDPQRIHRMPEPKPMYEIFVYSPRVEAVHLRGGRVARGGLRWSDRREDFRTEVLGLVKAQMVKNAVIVPTGSKGGFVVKRPPPEEQGRERLMEEVVSCYKTFIRGLLDVTDNLRDGAVTPPPGVIRHDDDDPYLVIAADKGTATFSDVANEVAAEYDFWLGDGFASGGSAGYDHKKMGITARGAWKSVAHHFRELGIDVQTMPFSVIGIGDMSGDVFGNGMLLSRHIKLVGAFNHLHIFLDPDPDPETSFQERRRLFHLPRSGWNDYDGALVSKGGGVFARSAKSVPLSPEIRNLLQVSAASMPPNDLINLMLKAPVDLLWNGGIGTYVKAAPETDGQIGDRANDSIRVCGHELRCRVVGEGGNLGLTQLGRIEYCARGEGRCFSDFIDNSGGVSASDHEVNIKILLNDAVASGDLPSQQRNPLLAKMTDEVADLVLDDNYAQSRVLGFASHNAPATLANDARMIDYLERSGQLNRALEFLPSAGELSQRAAVGQGLTRPELATLLAYGKISLYNELIRSQLPESPFLHNYLVDYFPTHTRKKYRKLMDRHQLRHEIITTALTNEMLNYMGPTFVYRMAELGGVGYIEVARAYAAVMDVFSMKSAWLDIRELDNRVSCGAQYEMMWYAIGLVERATAWLLRNWSTPIDIAATVEHFRPGVRQLFECMPKSLAAPNRAVQARNARKLLKHGVPSRVAGHFAGFIAMSSALDIVEVARQSTHSVSDAARVYFTLGARLELPWLRDNVAQLDTPSHWHTMARFELQNDLRQEHRALTTIALELNPSAGPKALLKTWLQRNHNHKERFLEGMRELVAAGKPDYATMSVAISQLKKLRRATT